MSGVIRLHGLKAQAMIGVHEWEQQQAQPIIFDIALSTDISAAVKSDKLEDALDYHALSIGLICLAEQSRYALIETLASKAADWLMENFKPTSLELTLYKPKAVEAANSVSITVAR